MQLPTVSPTVPIVLDGEQRELKFTLLAYEAMDLNPFDAESVQAFVARKVTPRFACQIVRAGLLWEYVEDAPRAGQKPPSVDALMGKLDFLSFMAMFPEIQKAMGTDDEKEPEETPANPPVA